MKNFFLLIFFLGNIYSSPVIVSFTTTSERIDLCLPMIESILRQTIAPDQFVLNISLEPYPNSTDQGFSRKRIPDRILEIVKDGLMEIQIVPNLGPFKKLGPILAKHFEDKECQIITCDDDIIYPNFWLELLLKKSAKYPDHVIAATIHVHEISEDYITPFSLAPKVRYQELLDDPKYKTFTFMQYLTGFGMLVKPKFFTEKILDFDKFLKYLPFDDDFFVSAELFNNKIPTRLIDLPHRHFWHIKMRDKDKIWVTKHRNGKIDQALYLMKKHFIKL